MNSGLQVANRMKSWKRYKKKVTNDL